MLAFVREQETVDNPRVGPVASSRFARRQYHDGSTEGILSMPLQSRVRHVYRFLLLTETDNACNFRP
jgi:hypothetical protein